MNLIRPTWRKSSHSGATYGGECVEVAPLVSAMGVRDSKTLERGHIEASPNAWTAFIHTLKR